VGLAGLAVSCLLSGCANSGNSETGPAVIGKTTDAPDTGQAGTGRAGTITVPKGSYVRGQGSVSLRLDISNSGAADQLVRVTSNVGGAGTLTPNPIAIPARGTLHVGTESTSAATSITLPVAGKLDRGETIAVTLSFAKNGRLLVYALNSS
jgi:hypothetical protein